MNIKDIARMANVSVSSVSRVINKQPGVNPNARSRVEKIIRETGYRPNLLARELITKKTKVIGIILPAVHNYYTARINAVTEFCRKNDYSVMLANSMESASVEIRNFHLLYEKQVDGILFFASGLTENHIKTINEIRANIPIVVTDQEFPNSSIPSILHDNYGGACQAVQHLIDIGHSKICYVKGPEFDNSAQLRYKAYLDTLKKNNISLNNDYIFQGDYKFDSGYEIGKNILTLKKKPTAVFASNDLTAIGIIKSLQNKGLSIPEDFSVAGYDNIPAAEYITPSLTTVRQYQHEEGTLAAQTLLNLINNIYVSSKEMLPSELIIRESTSKL